MEKDQQPVNTTQSNEHKHMPVKTTATDHQKNTAAEEGLNKEKTANNDLEPGTAAQDPDFTETD